MLHILLVILKILGIILACVLGLLLLLVLIVLFVPIRYRVDAKWREEVIVKMRADWLLRIVLVRLWFIDQQLHIKLRIFGFTFYDNLAPKKEKKVKKKKSAKKKSKKAKPSKNSNKAEKPELDEKQKLAETNEVDETQNKVTELENHQEIPDHQEVSEQQETSVQLSKQQPELLVDRLDSMEEERNKARARQPMKEVSSKGKNRSFKKKGGIKSLFAKIKGILKKIKNLGNTIKDKATKIVELVRKLLDKKSLVSVFLSDELNRSGFKIALGQLLEVLRHCGPQKTEGYIKFGTGDPEKTGEILGIAAVFYGIYGKNVTIEPDFENKVFEAEGWVKGRIRIIRLLIIGSKVIRDKNFKQLLKNARQLKEEL